MNSSKQLNPAVAGVIIAVVVVVAVLLGYSYMNRPKSDPIAEAVAKQRGSTKSAGAELPMGRKPPQNLSTDYGVAAPSSH